MQLSEPKPLDTEIQIICRGYPPFALMRTLDGRVALCPERRDYNSNSRYLLNTLPVYYKGV